MKRIILATIVSLAMVSFMTPTKSENKSVAVSAFTEHCHYWNDSNLGSYLAYVAFKGAMTAAYPMAPMDEGGAYASDGTWCGWVCFNIP